MIGNGHAGFGRGDAGKGPQRHLASIPISPAARPRRARHSHAAKPGSPPTSSRSPGRLNDVCTRCGDDSTLSAASAARSSRSPSPASSPASAGRPPPLTNRSNTIAPGTLPERARAPRKAHNRPSRPASLLSATRPSRPRSPLDGEPRRIPGLEVTKPSNISLTPASRTLDLPPVPPRQRPTIPPPGSDPRRSRKVTVPHISSR